MTPQPGTPEFKEWLDDMDLWVKAALSKPFVPVATEVLQDLINGYRLAERYREAIERAPHGAGCGQNGQFDSNNPARCRALLRLLEEGGVS